MLRLSKSLTCALLCTVFIIGTGCSSNSNESARLNSNYIPVNSNVQLQSAVTNAMNAVNAAAKRAMEGPLGKRAIVITENANLRRSDTSKSDVIQTIAQGTNVEWVEQRGAWFSVKNSGKTGWMHGNTIRLLPSSPPLTESTTSQSDSSGDVMQKISDECARQQRTLGHQSPLCDDVKRNGIP